MRPKIARCAWVLSLGLAGCASSGAAPAPDSGTSFTPQDATLPLDGSFAASLCGSCVRQQCTTAIAACSGDPDCAAYLTCLEGCGLGPEGNVDPPCEAACPRGSSTAGAQAEEALTQCRTMGAGAGCAACGLDAGAGDPLVNQACAPSSDPRPCARCKESFCCDSVAKCAANPDCYPFVDCTNACESAQAGDGGILDAGPLDGGYLACDEYCLQSHPTALNDVAPFGVCIAFHCFTACGGSDADTCQTCQTTKCANEYVSFNSLPSSVLLNDCTESCDPQTATCFAACEDAYPQAKPAFEAFNACVAGQCPACQ